MAHTEGNLAESGLGPEERSALIGTHAKEPEAILEAGDSEDPTQQLLLVLGHFQRTVGEAKEGADNLWTDECMNQLIQGVEISLSQGWTHLVDAFTDSGRILQSYENADQATDALPFLEGAYEILCSIVGELMSGGVRPEVLDAWMDEYNAAVQALTDAGLKLVDDSGAIDDEGEGDGPMEPEDQATPFNFPDLKSSNEAKTRRNTELPTLAELPPLDNLIPLNAPRVRSENPDRGDISEEKLELVESIQEQAADIPEAEEEVADPAPREDSGEPSKVIVDIVDRICDELGELSSRSPEDRILALEMIDGGISALKREAEKLEFETPASLCTTMNEACRLIMVLEGPVDESFVEICFAFCGIYVEAMNEPESENVTDWKSECAGLVEEWRPSETPDAEATAPAEETTDSAEEEEAVESASEPDAPAAIAETQETVTHVTAEPAAASEPTAEPVVDTTQGQALFLRAQEALASGNAEGAKALALEAAAMIAHAEVKQAEQRLQDCEGRLKASLDATVDGRGSLKESEKRVKSTASDVTAGERALGDAKERTAAMAQELSEAHENVADLDDQIKALQSKHEEALENVEAAETALEAGNASEGGVSNRLDGLRAGENKARKDLESSRQQIKDLHRMAVDIESQMEKARETLTKHRMSFEDIRQTIGKPPATDTSQEKPAEELLF